MTLADPASTPIARPESPIASDGLQRLDPLTRRALVAEDNLRREVASNQALVAEVRALVAEVRALQGLAGEAATALREAIDTVSERDARIAELEALCRFLAVEPHFTPGVEPAFLPLAEVRRSSRLPDEAARTVVAEFLSAGPTLTTAEEGTALDTVLSRADLFAVKRRDFFRALDDAEQARAARARPFQVGDIVRIARKVETDSKGRNCHWYLHMDKWLGAEAAVSVVNPEEFAIPLGVDVGGGFYYSPEALDLVTPAGGAK